MAQVEYKNVRIGYGQLSPSLIPVYLFVSLATTDHVLWPSVACRSQLSVVPLAALHFHGILMKLEIAITVAQCTQSTYLSLHHRIWAPSATTDWMTSDRGDIAWGCWWWWRDVKFFFYPPPRMYPVQNKPPGTHFTEMMVRWVNSCWYCVVLIPHSHIILEGARCALLWPIPCSVVFRQHFMEPLTKEVFVKYSTLSNIVQHRVGGWVNLGTVTHNHLSLLLWSLHYFPCGCGDVLEIRVRQLMWQSTL